MSPERKQVVFFKDGEQFSPREASLSEEEGDPNLGSDWVRLLIEPDDGSKFFMDRGALAERKTLHLREVFPYSGFKDVMCGCFEGLEVSFDGENWQVENRPV